MKERFPRLYSYALDENIAATQVLSVADITSLFHLPLSRQAFQELGSMQQLLNDNPCLEQRMFGYIVGEKIILLPSFTSQFTPTLLFRRFFIGYGSLVVL
jgi:hypothetical protein